MRGYPHPTLNGTNPIEMLTKKICFLYNISYELLFVCKFVKIIIIIYTHVEAANMIIWTTRTYQQNFFHRYYTLIGMQVDLKYINNIYYNWLLFEEHNSNKKSLFNFWVWNFCCTVMFRFLLDSDFCFCCGYSIQVKHNTKNVYNFAKSQNKHKNNIIRILCT